MFDISLRERRAIILDDKLRDILKHVRGHDHASIRKALDPVIEAVRSMPPTQMGPIGYMMEPSKCRTCWPLGGQIMSFRLARGITFKDIEEMGLATALFVEPFV